ncbi:peptide transporter [Saccharibacter sp. 17.LH.SD]|uniref:peptide transporter n=1 Tax=Saccharibacter sp. 17.LH.SD TaxID=2689393 RepID=UPI00136B02F6|nr:peptide transporter [Saccharibacter sp. 17.LH.SD]MXV44501.1 peptide transporter [Saccharibacter sp. 17.LH.SD]
MITPFISGQNEQENLVLHYLRQRSPTEAQLLVERLPQGTGRAFLEGWLLFLKGESWRAADFLMPLASLSPIHPFSLLQKELEDDEDEHRFLSLVQAGEAYTPNSPYLAELSASSHLQLGQLTKAERAVRDSLRYHPHHHGLENTLATIFYHYGAFGECLTLLRKLCDANPGRWEPISNLACVLNHLGAMEEAIDLYRRGIAKAPNAAQMRLNHSIALLKAGRFAQGWNEHEWRLKLPGHTSLPQERILPSLTPTTRLQGLRILVTQEEGLGDTLMYLRYVPWLARYGAHVHVWGTRALANLTQNVEGVRVVQVGGARPDYDYHCPFISLPRVFNGLAESFMGVPTPYLRVSPEKTAYWKERLNTSGSQRLRVGVAWAGGRHRNDRLSRLVDRQRSMALTALKPLRDLTQVDFYNLQKGEAAAQLAHSPFPMIDLMPECQDMEDTAALIQSLDLVISVDTSIVHLSGGLGKDTILMDRFCNCWRWGYNTNSSPWYPSLQIIRQEQFNDWTTVTRQVRNEIEKRSLIKTQN